MMSSNSVIMESTSAMPAEDASGSQLHELGNTWTLYAHLPHDTDWSIKSYKTILTTNYLEHYIKVIESLPDTIISNCMLFIMKEGVAPIWEDPKNKQGGCFSYKISNKNVVPIFRKFAYKLAGGTMFKKNTYGKFPKDNINGITISPKKNFCIIKVWFSDCTNKNPDTIDYFTGVSSHGCLFKKHLA